MSARVLCASKADGNVFNGNLSYEMRHAQSCKLYQDCKYRVFLFVMYTSYVFNARTRTRARAHHALLKLSSKTATT